ncbi:MAG: dienelactone hydrolase family protein [Defluviicoccus sp.]|nr:dienelactone hydrolase family protein [Defluviicoccus sp.]MDE0383442.1 dienelactone hydrolase family protein [Defluviicoccus sp.]
MAEIPVPYSYDGRDFEGMLVCDDSVTEPRPAILMQPDWLGVSRHGIEIARDFGGSDYVVMMADMFGAGYGEREKTFDELMKISRAVRADLPHILGCGRAADRAMTAEAEARGLVARSGARGIIGYCIGGGFALEQSRAGADYAGTVAFHVTLPQPVDGDAKPDFKGPVLVFHGSADPVTPREMIDTLEAELTGAGIDWQVMMYGHASHSFCDIGMFNELQRYDEKLTRQSYEMTRYFFSGLL